MVCIRLSYPQKCVSGIWISTYSRFIKFSASAQCYTIKLARNGYNEYIYSHYNFIVTLCKFIASKFNRYEYAGTVIYLEMIMFQVGRVKWV